MSRYESADFQKNALPRGKPARSRSVRRSGEVDADMRARMRKLRRMWARKLYGGVRGSCGGLGRMAHAVPLCAAEMCVAAESFGGICAAAFWGRRGKLRVANVCKKTPDLAARASEIRNSGLILRAVLPLRELPLPPLSCGGGVSPWAFPRRARRLRQIPRQARVRR